MYIPKHYLVQDEEQIVAFMQRFSFATIVTIKDNLPVASHLPFIIRKVNEQIVLTSHFAKANEQWKYISGNKVLVIFSEPHAYISPMHYDKQENVPTWNYLSVHAYGDGRITDNEAETFSTLEDMIDYFEKGYKEQWNSLSDDYKKKMVKGIVAFDIEVTELQAKKKLSQNKNEAERNRIIHSLSQSRDSNEQVIAAYMKDMSK